MLALDRAPTDTELAYRAQRALMRAKLIDEWHILPRLATAYLDEWADEAVARTIAVDDERYWRDAEPWLAGRAGRP
jgi:hypothetical protein